MNRTASITRPNIPLTPTRPYIADPRDMAAITGKPIEQCHVHPIHLKPCDTCRHGCDCDGSTGTLACGHFACWGRGHDNIVDCHGVAYEKARKAALSGEREQAQIKAARRRYDGSLPRVIADILTAHGLAVGDDELAA